VVVKEDGRYNKLLVPSLVVFGRKIGSGQIGT
jgi:hypothetical protein